MYVVSSAPLAVAHWQDVRFRLGFSTFFVEHYAHHDARHCAITNFRVSKRTTTASVKAASNALTQSSKPNDSYHGIIPVFHSNML